MVEQLPVPSVQAQNRHVAEDSRKDQDANLSKCSLAVSRGSDPRCFPAHILRDLVIFTSGLGVRSYSNANVTLRLPNRNVTTASYFSEGQVCQCVSPSGSCSGSIGQQPGFCPRSSMLLSRRVDPAQVFTLVAIRTQRQRKALLSISSRVTAPCVVSRRRTPLPTRALVRLLTGHAE